jgi:hypothetical protein
VAPGTSKNNTFARRGGAAKQQEQYLRKTRGVTNNKTKNGDAANNKNKPFARRVASRTRNNKTFTRRVASPTTRQQDNNKKNNNNNK